MARQASTACSGIRWVSEIMNLFWDYNGEHSLYNEVGSQDIKKKGKHK